MTRLALLAAVLLCGAAFSGELTERWVHIQTNHQTDKNIDDLEAIMRRAAAAGYTGIQLNDSKFAKLDDLGSMTSRYTKNVERVKRLAKELNLELIPGLFSLGYSNDLLWHNPNLAEGLPVVNAPFEVKDGVARIAAPKREFGKPAFHDKNVALADGVWTMTANGENARINFKAKVEPFRQYHISAKIKTEAFKGEPKINVLAGGKGLAQANLGVKATQDWTDVHQVFNSQDATDINIYFGAWGAKSGVAQWKDLKWEEVGLLNLLRRDGCPFKVTGADGAELVEGKDFEKVVDPLMGSKPYNGQYTVYHEPPVIRTKLPDGTKLAVSYYHVLTVYDGQVMICPSEPETIALLKKQAQLLHAAFGAKKYFMHFDEIRCLNHCGACRARKLEPGAIIADTARTCTAIMKELVPGVQLFTWNDMFDPHHNAVPKNYYLVHGDLTKSWEGLDKDTTIVAWHFSKRDASMDFFAQRGHPIIAAGYYDGSHDTKKWVESLNKIPTARGIMYTTWEKKFGELEAFLKAVGK